MRYLSQEHLIGVHLKMNEKNLGLEQRLLESLDLELTLSGLEETDLNFRNYIFNKYKQVNQSKPICSECGKKIEDREYIKFSVCMGNHEKNDVAIIYLDKKCMFSYVFKVVLRRLNKYPKK